MHERPGCVGAASGSRPRRGAASHGPRIESCTITGALKRGRHQVPRGDGVTNVDIIAARDPALLVQTVGALVNDTGAPPAGERQCSAAPGREE
jgi:hypothetical protein